MIYLRHSHIFAFEEEDKNLLPIPRTLRRKIQIYCTLWSCRMFQKSAAHSHLLEMQSRFRHWILQPKNLHYIHVEHHSSCHFQYPVERRKITDGLLLLYTFISISMFTRSHHKLRTFKFFCLLEAIVVLVSLVKLPGKKLPAKLNFPWCHWRLNYNIQSNKNMQKKAFLYVVLQTITRSTYN